MYLLDTNVISELRKTGQGKADTNVASTALVHDMTVVTRNVADFSGLHVPMLNPWNKH